MTIQTKKSTKRTPFLHQTTNNTTLLAPTSIIMNESVVKESKSGDNAKEVYPRGGTTNLSKT